MLKFFLKTSFILTLTVIMLGAYTRLEHAGLGCPDWPGCYGSIKAPTTTKEINIANQLYPESKVDVKKAWIEMIHRYAAGILGFLIISISFYIILGRGFSIEDKFIAFLLLPLLLFQALLGMWTVTLKLLPLVVMGHLLGGISLLSLIYILFLKNSYSSTIDISYNLNRLLNLNIFFVVMQIILGGWTSANYAAIVCPDFPFCHGELIPNLSFNAFLPFSDLEAKELITIQVAHRIGALIVTCLLLTLIMNMLFLSNKRLNKLGLYIMLLLIIQISLGITNVLAGLPILIAVAHNACAAILLMSLLTVKTLSTTKFYGNQRLFYSLQT